MTFQLHHGDCLELLRKMPSDIFDSVVTDPPYGIKFMQNHWDYSVPSVAVWAEVLRVLKPGGHLLSFASPRTQHRMVCRIEDAGFEVCDVIGWLYAQGMPKSGRLKPAYEPITMARKPAKRVTPLQIDACRIVRPNGDRTEYGVDGDECSPTKNSFADRQRVGYEPHAEGRYPANIIHDGSDEVVGLFPNNNPGCKPHRVKSSDESVARLQEKGWGFAGSDKVAGYDDGDNLSAARFFFCAKASRKERHSGLSDPGPQFKHGTTLRMVENTNTSGNTHPTVKPTELMRYLCRLVTPKGGTVLDPFMGSGSTGRAAMFEGFYFVGMDTDANYVEIARQRIADAAAEDLL